MIFIFIFLSINTLFSQEKVTIKPLDGIIDITASRDYIAVTIDSSFYLFNHDLWGEPYKKDTFFYVKKTLISKKNRMVVTPLFSSMTYKLNKNLHNKLLIDQDSIIIKTIREQYCSFKPSTIYKPISCKITPVYRKWDTYPYIDIHRTMFYISSNEYISISTRVFLIKDVHYLISIYTHNGRYMNSPYCSRKAIRRDFKRLVNNIKIIEGEEGCGTN